MATYEPLKETKDNLEWRINHTTIAKCCYCISTYWDDTQIDHSLNLKYLRPADSSRWNMKENENLLKWSTSIMTIPLSSVIFFFRKNLHVVYHGRRQFVCQRRMYSWQQSSITCVETTYKLTFFVVNLDIQLRQCQWMTLFLKLLLSK